MRRKYEIEPIDTTGTDVLAFKKIDPYPLKYFFHKNGITEVQITRALGLSVSGHLGNEFAGYHPMPEWIDRKLRATALHLHNKKRVVWPLTKDEKDYCDNGPKPKKAWLEA